MAETSNRPSDRRWSLPADLPESGSVLLAGDPHSSHADDRCAALMTPATQRPLTLLYVAVTRANSTRQPVWMNMVGDSWPTRVCVVTAGGDPVSMIPAYDGSDGPPVPTTIETVADPADLTALGVAVTKCVRESGSNTRLAGCVRSLTGLLQYVELDRAYQFLDVLTSSMAGTDGRVHYHIDPSAHDERTMNTLISLFDAVVETDADGEAIVRTR